MGLDKAKPLQLAAQSTAIS